MTLDERLLAAYMERFVGFGSYEAGFWFVGMEQGGGEDLAELQRRLEAWQRLGGGEVVDFHEYLQAMGEHRWHGPKARIQSTLGQMIRIVLAAQGADTSSAAVRAYQAERFARTGGETLITELMPLPSRSVGHWIYGGLTRLPQLRTREAYIEAWGPARRQLLRDRIDRYTPKAVIMTGWSYMQAWSELIGRDLKAHEELGVHIGRRGDTTCIVCRHPTSFGAKSEYFTRIGTMLGVARIDSDS